MGSGDDSSRPKRSDRKVLAAGEMPDVILDAIKGAEMDPRHRALDDLLKDRDPEVSTSRVSS